MGMIRLAIELYSFVIIADAILSWAPQFEREPWRLYVKKAAGFMVEPIRKMMPDGIGFDFSHLIALIILQLIPTLW